MNTSATRSPLVIIGESRLPGQEIADQAKRLASGLGSLGVGENDAVSLLLRNDLACLVAGLAVRHLGARVVLINYRNKASEISYIMRDSRPAVVIGHSDLLWASRDILPDTPKLVVPGKCGEDISAMVRDLPGAFSWHDFLAAHEPLETVPGGATEAIIYTSGTTGPPKGVRRLPFEGDTGSQNMAEMARIFGIRPGSRVLALGPLYHSMPDTAAKLALAIADLLVVQAKFDPERTLQDIETHRITELTLVPTMFVRLLKLPQSVRERYDVSSLRTVTHTGAPCPPEIKRAMIEWWGPIINELYGATEVGVTFFVDSRDWLRKPGTVGRPMPHTDFAIIDDDGRKVPPNLPGEIFALNRLAPDWEYIGHEKTVRDDGLISVGDIGYVDEDGFLFLCDRKNDMIISGGVNVYPAEIEAVALTHPKILDCAVFGAPDPDMGERIVMAVALVEGEQADGTELRTYISNQLASYKVPKIVDFHSALPRQESGKVLRRELRAPYWDQAGRAI